ncbi:MAG: T9SS type A sorting domain-containing protein [Candidatus Krumholzibacteria bacterium]|nr:T9SS type A sorting domain-containing protein [Candidatus Krumholzibacteria bacterium]
MKRIHMVSLANAVVAVFCAAAFSQVPEPAPTVMGSGGGNSNDGTYYLSDTVGQPVIGISTDPANIIKAGFWYLPDGLHIGPTSPVAIATFLAAVADKGVELHWTIASADGLEGFKVYRSVDSKTGFVRLNDGGLIQPGVTSYLDASIEPGRTYWYRIGAVDRDGEFLSTVQSVTTPHRDVELQQNYPNPFNPSTTISYTLRALDGGAINAPRTNLTIYNMLGRKVRTLVDEVQIPGVYNVEWDGTDRSGQKVASGIYLYRLSRGDEAETRKMVLLK